MNSSITNCPEALPRHFAKTSQRHPRIPRDFSETSQRLLRGPCFLRFHSCRSLRSSRWFQMIPDGWFQMIPDDPRWAQRIPDDPRWSQMIPDVPSWSSWMIPDSPAWSPHPRCLLSNNTLESLFVFEKCCLGVSKKMKKVLREGPERHRRFWMWKMGLTFLPKMVIPELMQVGVSQVR